MMVYQRGFLVLGFAVFTCLSHLTTAAAQTLGDTRNAREYAITSEDNVGIGLPFSTVTGEFIGPNTCLTGFTESSNQRDAGPFDMSLVQVNDKVGVMRALDIDVSASMRMFGKGLDGKMRFAQTSQTSQASLNYTLFAKYRAAPIHIKSIGGQEIGLTKSAISALEEGVNVFRAKCGDSYVSKINQGAEAYGLLSFRHVDGQNKREIAASMDARGAGWKAGASASTAVEKTASSGNLRLSYGVTGGDTDAADGAPTPGGDSAKAWNDLLATAKALRGTRAPVVTGYQVVRYDGTLAGWVRGREITPGPDILRLAYYRAAYDALIDEINPLLSDPLGARFSHVMGRSAKDGAGNTDKLSALLIDIKDAQDKIIRLMENCRGQTGEDCENTASLDMAVASPETPHPYVFMTRLPLEMTSLEDAFLSSPDLAEQIYSQYLLSANNTYCEEDAVHTGRHPACLQHDVLRETYGKLVRDNVSVTRFPEVGRYQFRSESRRDRICLTAQSKGAGTKLYMDVCKSDGSFQMINWKETGQLYVRDTECIAGPSLSGKHVATHPCILVENQQMWRFVPTKNTPTDPAKAVHGMIQEAGYGRCLHAGYPIKGKNTWVQTRECDPTNLKMIWSVEQPGQ